MYNKLEKEGRSVKRNKKITLTEDNINNCICPNCPVQTMSKCIEEKLNKFRRHTTFFSHAPEIPICPDQKEKRRGRMVTGSSDNAFISA